ncbi:sigma 54-interacting transcriptional regulator [Tissierella pigra]|uniref:HTH-type transcriptional regulatory protein TyrR n=1 Tax=Tissierella pigra TaxID=2607614 RepID=A0A6N7XNF3_9FIRM|nr:sigma 54-interacting transcriptional regulator [Tissierella pigra]MBU5427714.1 sigma 54-interacting transcriptional regulator [Tissierella pigra]MSU03036.1 PAS domain S-box protein [Tissierella pigra]
MSNNKLLDHYKQAYEELKLILDLSYDQITIADGNGVFTRVSKSCEPYFGVQEKGIIGINAFELEKNGVFDVSVTAEVIRKGKKVTLIQKTGANKILMVTGIPILDENNNITKIINISRDITENQNLGLELKEVQSKLQWFQKELNKRQGIDSSDVSYKSPSMRKIMDLILHIADLDATVLLLGETGVGKGYISRVIHESSIRKNEPFVPINCGAIPENLLESELFGYESGAFSGANKGGKKGLFEIAGKGTIFLDEIGDMPMNLQVKLLHALEEKQIFRVGGERPIKIEGRLIAATNKDLKKLISEGKFREDLYYRLNVVPVTIPPLRERKEDIPGLVKKILDKCNKEHNTQKYISQGAYNILINYDYKGNIRELGNIIERLVITTLGDIIEDINVREILEIPNEQNNIDEIIPLKLAVEDLERRILISAFDKYKTTRKVAEVLKIDQSTVVKKAKKLNIKYC